MSVAVTAVGFFGKLPARGDFVRSGLPRGFVDPWDAWLRHVLPASRGIMGEAWEPAWLEAPVWRFALPPGVCGPEPVVGVWMASVDRAGRYFPLMLACVGADCADDSVFLSAAEAAGRAAIADDWAPEALLARLACWEDTGRHGRGTWNGSGAERMGIGCWWTDGSRRRPAGSLALTALPDEMTFAGMLDAGHGEPAA